MGTNTPYLNLYKPDPSELVDVVNDINANSDKVDAGALDLNDRLENVEGILGAGGWQAWAPEIRALVSGTPDVVLSHVTSVARYRVNGDIVTIQVETDVDDADLIQSGPRIKLPFENIRQGVKGNGMLVINDSGTVAIWTLRPFGRLTLTDKQFIEFGTAVQTVAQFDAANAPDTPSVDDANLSVFLEYTTNGVAVV
jgi:hypothetical protein